MSQIILKDPVVSSGPTRVGTGTGTCSVDRLTHFTIAQTYTLTCIAKSPDTLFSVSGSLDGAVGIATVGTQFYDDDLKIFLTITQGGTVFEAGDTFTIVVAAGTDLNQENIDSYDELPQKNFGAGQLGVFEGDHSLRYSNTAQAAYLYLGDLKFTAVATGSSDVSVAYTDGAAAGSEVVSVTTHAISIQIQSGVSTATQIKTAYDLVVAATALATVAINGSGAAKQLAPVSAQTLGGGKNKNFAFNHNELTDAGSFAEGNANLKMKDAFITGAAKITGHAELLEALSLNDQNAQNGSGLAVSNVQLFVNYLIKLGRIQLSTVGNVFATWSSGSLSTAGSANIEIYFRDSAIKNTISMASPIALTDGQSVYAYLNPLANVTVATTIATSVPAGREAFRLATRFGSDLFWFNGAVVADGESGLVGNNGSATAATNNAPVRRDGSGDFSAHNVTMNKALVAPGTGSGVDVSSAGNMDIGASVGANNINLGGSLSTVVVKGNLDVQGTTTTIESSTLTVADKNIVVNRGGNDASSEGAGISAERTGTSGSLIYAAAAASKWKLGALGAEVEVADISTAQPLTNKTIAPGSNSITLASAKVLVGSAGNVAAPVDLSGDVTVNNAGVTAIGANKVANTQLAQIATASFKGRTTAGTGNVEDLSATQATALLNTVGADSGSGGLKGLAPATGAGDAAAGKFLKADATWAVPPGTGLTALTGDVTASGSGSQVATIALNAVTNAKAAQMAAHTFKGNNTGSTANALDLTAAQLTAEVVAFVGDSGSGGTKGAVPAPASGDAAAGKFLKADGTFAVPPGSGSGGINYIANPGAETDTTGWTTYADAAQNTPVDATGGSPSSTWTRTTSTPLRSTGSFLWTRTAANRQGEGVAYAFTLDNADQSTVVAVSFDYKIASGTFFAADGITAPLNDGTVTQNAGMSDLEVFIYDVTNAVLIPVSPQVFTSTSGTSAHFKGTFQAASNSTSYRLVIHTARSTAVAFTAQFDNFSVGPQSVSYGAPISDWVLDANFTPNSFGTVSLQSIWRSRNGDSMRVRGYFKTGTNAAATASISLPAGYVIDSSKLTSTANAQKMGMWQGISTGGSQNIASGGSQQGDLVYDGSDTAKLYVVPTTASNAYTKTNASSILTSGDGCSFDFEVPIAGWSSTVQMSNDTDTRVVAARYTGGTASVSGTPAVVKFSTLAHDTHGAYNPVTGLYTVPVSGLYDMFGTFMVDHASVTAGQSVSAYIYKNGVQTARGLWEYANTTNNDATPAVTCTIQCVAGDTLAIYVDSSATSPTLSSNAVVTYFTVQRLSGPSAVAATDSIGCRYTASGATSVANSGTTIVNFDVKDYDTHGAVTTGASWKFTAPAAGRYMVTSGVVFATGVYAVGNQCSLRIDKNGSEKTFGPIQAAQTTTSIFLGVGVVDIIQLAAGDTLDIRAANNRTAGATNTDSGDDVYVAISRLGN